MRFKSLRTRTNGAILTTCILTFIFFGAILYPVELHRKETRLEKIQVLLSSIFQQKKDELANDIFAGRELALKHSFKEMLQVKDLAMLSVFDSEGRLVISTEDSRQSPLSVSEMERLNQNPQTFLKRIINGRSFAEFSTPIDVIGERIGYFKMYYDLSNEEKESLVSISIFSLLLILTLLIMAVFLNLLLSRFVIRPVTDLREAIGKVRKGHFGEKVIIKSLDEIGEMAESFNEMSERLKDQHSEIQEAIHVKDSYSRRLEEANEELERLNNRLEDMVQERTVELRKSNIRLLDEIKERKRIDKDKRELEERLARSQKMEALGLLAGGVAHDLNNVLSGIVSYPDLLLLNLPEHSSMRRPILAIQESGKKAAAIVQDLLDLARRGVTHREVLNLNDIIKEYLRSPELEALKEYHPKIVLEIRLDSKLLNIRGSTVHLKKTIMNLVSNAAEAQPAGGKITISTENRYVDRPIKGYDKVEEGDFVVLEVKDKGIGIAVEDLQRIFEPFYTKKVMGRNGTGLGMSVVWGTMQDHKGYIDIDSKENMGTVFRLYFPICREALSPKPEAVRLELFTGHSEKILVIDDIREQQEIASQLLSRLGYCVATVSSGEEAIDYLKNNPVDLIVLDMIMDPKMDGLDTYSQVLLINPHQKTIIASGFAETDRVKKALSLGVGQFLKKPYTLENLGLAVREELDQANRKGLEVA